MTELAFRRLGGVLAGVGDKEGAVTMWHQSYSLTKYDNDRNGEDEELVEQSIICRGCHRSVRISNISICRYCHNIILCATCLPLRRSGSLAVNICSQKHDWIPLLPLPESLRQRGEGQKDMVCVEDHWIRLDELKRQLMLRWGIK
jgi:hypothetical protein